MLEISTMLTLSQHTQSHKHETALKKNRSVFSGGLWADDVRSGRNRDETVWAGGAAIARPGYNVSRCLSRYNIFYIILFSICYR